MMSERNYEVRVYGDQGMILLELWKGKLAFHDSAGQVQYYPDIPETGIYPVCAPVENLVDSILKKADTLSSGRLGLYAMKAVERHRR